MCRNCKKTYYITTAIAYTSGKPHIGNTYEIVLQTVLPDIKGSRALTSVSRLVRTNTVRK